MQERWEANIRGMDVELIDKIILLISCIVEVYILYDFFNGFSEVKGTLNGKLKSYIVITILTLYMINLAENSYINLFLVPVTTWCFVSVVFDINIRLRFFYFIEACSIIIGGELLYLILSKISTLAITTKGFVPLSENVWQIIVIKLITYIIFIIIRQVSSKTRVTMPTNVFMMYLCLPIATLGMMLVVFYSGVDFEDNVRQKVLMTFFLILMLVGNILIFYAFNKYSNQMQENADKKMIIVKQEAELIHLHEVIQKNEKQQEIFHDTVNYLKTIDKLAKAGQSDKITDILNELNTEIEKNLMTSYSSSVVLNALLSEKFIYAKNKNVVLDILVEPDICIDSLQEIDMISMLGNLLDNAIRAAEECVAEKNVKTRIFMQNNRNILVIKVVNNFCGEIQMKNGKILSTKKEKGMHGLGIKSVVHTAEKYDGYLDFFIENKKFISILILPI